MRVRGLRKWGGAAMVVTAGVLGLGTSASGLQVGGDHCRYEQSSGGTDYSSTLTCCGAGYPQDGPNGTWCFNPGGLPGQPPPPPPPQDPGGGGGGGGGGGCQGPNCDDPPECQPGQRPIPPSGKLLVHDSAAVQHLHDGDVVVLTDELLKAGRVVEFTPDQVEVIERQIDVYMAEKDKEPKPVCKETCRSCTKTKEASNRRRQRGFSTCNSDSLAIAQESCRQGHWRNDPRRGDSCGLVESLHSEWCDQNPGLSVDEWDCELPTPNPHAPNADPVQHCTKTSWFQQCENSWTADIPDTQITNTSRNWSVPIGPVTLNTGTETITVTTPGGRGYNSACDEANRQAMQLISKEHGKCWERVERANPGVTCP
jgi:hypothetical protein